MKSKYVVLMCAFAAVTAVAQDSMAPKAATTAVVASKGKMLVAANGGRLGSVYRVSPDGSAEIFIDGKLVTIPAATLSSASDGKLTTSLSKSEVIGLH
jgi:hypothetical protein